jgi:asparagine synthase (glutamine-hydrolysing)
MKDHISDLKNALSHSISRNLMDMDTVAVLFSGGLDSSLLVYLIKHHVENVNIILYAVGTKDSQDIRNSHSAADLLEMKPRNIIIDSQDILSSIPILSRIIETTHPVKLSYELPLYLGMAQVKEKNIVSGQGADELFGGYSRYLKMTQEELEFELEKDYETLVSQDIEMNHKVALHFDLTLITPYLDEAVVKSAQDIPLRYKVSDGQRKIILREVAKAFDLPPSMVNKEKKAVQYSSGIIKELRRLSKEQNMGVNELLNSIISENSD